MIGWSVCHSMDAGEDIVELLAVDALVVARVVGLEAADLGVELLAHEGPLLLDDRLVRVGAQIEDMPGEAEALGRLGEAVEVLVVEVVDRADDPHVGKVGALPLLLAVDRLEALDDPPVGALAADPVVGLLEAVEGHEEGVPLPADDLFGVLGEVGPVRVDADGAVPRPSCSRRGGRGRG